MPFSPNDELTMRFTVSEWNQVLAQLQEGPWKIVAPLINKINVQAAQHEKQSAGGYTNGGMQTPQPEQPSIAERLEYPATDVKVE
jgi:hypothetical protein